MGCLLIARAAPGDGVVSPLVAALSIRLTESPRILFGTRFIGAANTIYGILLIVFTIFMPVGILGFVVRCWERRTGPIMERTIPSATGRHWKVIGIG